MSLPDWTTANPFLTLTIGPRGERTTIKDDFQCLQVSHVGLTVNLLDLNSHFLRFLLIDRSSHSTESQPTLLPLRVSLESRCFERRNPARPFPLCDCRGPTAQQNLCSQVDGISRLLCGRQLTLAPCIGLTFDLC